MVVPLDMIGQKWSIDWRPYIRPCASHYHYKVQNSYPKSGYRIRTEVEVQPCDPACSYYIWSLAEQISTASTGYGLETLAKDGLASMTAADNLRAASRYELERTQTVHRTWNPA